ncbi:MAG: hypothetical protein MR979_00095, partial [Mollicutes bacterium]|nr:hypothetical protein [Mollicutes bacterium]
MNWMICYDYGKDGNHVFSDMIENKDTAVEALKAYQEKYDDDEARIVAVVPVDKDVFKDYYDVNDDENFSKGQDAVKKMRNEIAHNVGSYEKKIK